MHESDEIYSFMASYVMISMECYNKKVTEKKHT